MCITQEIWKFTLLFEHSLQLWIQPVRSDFQKNISEKNLHCDGHDYSEYIHVKSKTYIFPVSRRAKLVCQRRKRIFRENMQFFGLVHSRNPLIDLKAYFWSFSLAKLVEFLYLLFSRFFDKSRFVLFLFFHFI